MFYDILRKKLSNDITFNDTFECYFPEKCTDERFLRLNASCFSVIRKETTFYEAQRLCREIGAELASIHDREENTFLANVINLRI